MSAQLLFEPADEKGCVRPLFILEMANNHMGSVDHGLAIIRELHKAVGAMGIRCAIKFQYRQLDSFIHPDFATRDD
ncbi:MAG: hypothetical protein ACREKL_17415, partial [Chthoniobacterales bacterium]